MNLEMAAHIGDLLLDQAAVDDDGALTWGRGMGGDMQQVADGGMFNGRIGEAVFFAALFVATGRKEFRESAFACCRRLRRATTDEALRAAIVEELALGLQGAGGVIYGLTLVAAWIDDPPLLAAAHAIAATIPAERVEADTKCDVYWGTAGLIPAFLALHRAGCNGAAERARGLADWLIERRVVDPVTGIRAWCTGKDVPCAGYAHGGTGIAGALLAVFRIFPHSAYLTASLDEFDFERAVRRATGEWLDFEGYSARISGWCHGAPGIALGRLVMISAAPDHVTDDVVSDLDDALSRTIQSPMPVSDSLCCGTIGRADIAMHAGTLLGNSSLLREGRQILERAVRRVRGNSYAVRASTSPHTSPGLWQGLAGIGYTLIRADDPDRWPSLLSME